MIGVVRRPHEGSDPGGGRPRAHMPPLETVNPLLARDVCLDVPGQWCWRKPSDVMTDNAL